MPPSRRDRLIDYSNLAGDVSDVLREDNRRAELRTMSKPQRKQAERNRMNLDIPADLEEELVATAQELGVPISQVAIWWMLRGREVSPIAEMAAARVQTKSMRYDFVLFPPRGTPKGNP